MFEYGNTICHFLIFTMCLVLASFAKKPKSISFTELRDVNEVADNEIDYETFQDRCIF
jgi:hypothetical protein